MINFVKAFREAEIVATLWRQSGWPYLTAKLEERLLMTRWSIVVSEDTDRTVRRYLARTGGDGKRGDLSRFVVRAVRQAIFWETVDSIWERNKHLSAEEVQALADEAVAQVRADCRRTL